MRKAHVDQRLFLVGCPRSGTTLLQSLLAAHPDVASFPESKFFLNLIPEYEPRRQALGIASRRVRPLLSQFFEEIGCPELQANLPLTPHGIRHYVRIFVKSLDQATLQQAKRVWLEKTPEHLHYASYIERLVPGVKLIHIVRNGADVIASLDELRQTYPHPWGKAFHSLDDCINTWIKAIEASALHLHKPNHLLVRYEDLVAAPAIELQRICQFIGIDYSNDMLSSYQATSKQLRRDRECWKASVGSAIVSTNAQKFDRLFSAAQQQHIFERLSQVEVGFASPQRSASSQRMS